MEQHYLHVVCLTPILAKMRLMSSPTLFFGQHVLGVVTQTQWWSGVVSRENKSSPESLKNAVIRVTTGLGHGVECHMVIYHSYHQKTSAGLFVYRSHFNWTGVWNTMIILCFSITRCRKIAVVKGDIYVLLNLQMHWMMRIWRYNTVSTLITLGCNKHHKLNKTQTIQND